MSTHAGQSAARLHAEMSLRDAERRWRRDVMSDAKDALAEGDVEGAWLALTRHEREGYPWAAVGAPSRNPDEAREFTLLGREASE